MTDDDLIDSLESTLGRLESTTTSAVVTVAIAAAAAVAKPDDTAPVADLGFVTIPLSTAGSIAFLIFLIISIRVFRSLAWIEAALAQMNAETKEKAAWKLRNHLWFFNPCYEGKGRFHSLTDHTGLMFLIVMWWFAAYSGLGLHARAADTTMVEVIPQMITTPSLWPSSLAYLLFLLVGAGALRIMWALVKDIATTKQVAGTKLVLNNAGALVGFLSGFAVFHSYGLFG